MKLLEGLLNFSHNSLGIFSKLSDIFLMTNILFSFALIVFVVLFGVRMVSSTKVAAFLVFLSFCVMIPFFPMVFQSFAENLKFLFIETFVGKVGILFCLISIIRVLIGLREEERTQEYVHGQYYWFISAILMYFGMFFVSIAGVGTKVLVYLL